MKLQIMNDVLMTLVAILTFTAFGMALQYALSQPVVASNVVVICESGAEELPKDDDPYLVRITRCNLGSATGPEILVKVID